MSRRAKPAQERRTTVLFLADMHVGSRWGIFPEGFVGSAGAEVNLNAGQRYLLDGWRRMLSELPEQVDYLLLVGDVIDGQNLKEGGRGLCEVDPQAQARAAAELLRPILERSRSVYVLRGTPYHAGVSAEDEEFLAEMLQAERCNDGRRTWPWLLLDVDGVLLDVAHRQSYMMRYRSTALEREVGFLLERAEGTLGTFCIVRAHTHNFVLLDLADRVSISLPGWKLQDAYAQTSLSPNRTLPRWLGAVGLSVSEGVIADVAKYLFPHPAPSVVRSGAGGAAESAGKRNGR